MSDKEILNKYGEEMITRMVFNKGTIKDQLKDKEILEKDSDLRSYIAKLKTQMYIDEEVYYNQLINEFEGTQLYDSDKNEEEDIINLSAKDFDDFFLDAEAADLTPQIIPEGVPIKVPMYAWLLIAALIVIVPWLGWNIYQSSLSGPDLDPSLALQELDNISLLEPKSQGIAISPTDTSTCYLSKEINRKEFSRLPFNDFSKNLSAYTAKTPNEQICVEYWEGWLDMNKPDGTDYKSAIVHFERVWNNQPHDVMHQEVAHGLLVAYILDNQDQKAIELSQKLLKEPVLWSRTHDFAKVVRDIAGKSR